MDEQPSVIAADIYDVELTPPRHGPVRRVVSGVIDTVAAVGGGLIDVSTAGDLVVRRRADGHEVFRVPGGGPEEAAHTIEHVEAQLRTLTPEEFRDRWEPAG